jgi:hypothetical protein
MGTSRDTDFGLARMAMPFIPSMQTQDVAKDFCSIDGDEKLGCKDTMLCHALRLLPGVRGRTLSIWTL